MSMKIIPTLLLFTGITLTFLAQPDPPGLFVAWVGGLLIGFTRPRGS